jgi:hypothetical protein
MSELEPQIRQQPLDAEVAARRSSYEASLLALNATFLPRIEGHLLVLQDAVDGITALHRTVVDESDLDLDADTRWVALWEVAGRCLALANLLLAEIRLGFTAETHGTIRVLDEANQLLHALAVDEDGATLRRWLDGETVMPRDARPLVEAEQRAVEPELSARGIEVGVDIVALGKEVYGHLSKGAHNARPGFSESVSRPLRTFNYGPHPDPRQRATYVDYASELVEGTLIQVGNALARVYGGDWYRYTVPPIQAGLEAVRQALPIDKEERARYGF